MSAESLLTDELIINAEIGHEYPEDEYSIERVHERLRRIMELEGYRPVKPEKTLLNKRTIKYTIRRPREDPALFTRIVDSLTPGRKSEGKPEDYHDHLARTRDDQPYRIEFKFFPLAKDGMVDLRARITVRPAVVEQHQQVERQEDYNTRNIVRTCKEFTKTIAAELGWRFVTAPHTPAESLRSTINSEIRTVIDQAEYGSKIIQFADEGDEALKYGLDYSALASYIHAIEWCIITYLKMEDEEFDVIEKEGNDPGLGYSQLVDELEKHTSIHQTTIENLRKHKTDRRIMAHHKSGKLSESHVHSVKDTLRNLIQESFSLRPDVRQN